MDSIYTHDIDIDQDGISLATQHAHVLSIKDRTKVWGLLVKPGSSSDGEEESLPRQIDSDSIRQLLLTPVPVDAWPVCFQLRIQVQDRPGSLAKALRALTMEGVNVLHVDYGPGGARFSSVDVVCEFPALRAWAEKVKQVAYRRLFERTASSHVDDYKLLSDYAAVIAARIYASMQLVMWKLRLRHTLPTQYDDESATHEGTREAIKTLIEAIDNWKEIPSNEFLDSRFLFGKRLFSLFDGEPLEEEFLSSLEHDEFLESLDDDELCLLLLQSITRTPELRERPDDAATGGDAVQTVSPATLRACKLDRILRETRQRAIRFERRAVSGYLNAGLLQAWMLELNPAENTFRGRYMADEGKIRPYDDSKERYVDSFEASGICIPQRATASFIPSAKYLRATLIAGESYKRRFRIEIDYKVALPEGPDSSSMGLFSSVASALEDFPAALIKFESVLNEHPSAAGFKPDSEEVGRVVVVGVRPEGATHESMLGQTESLKKNIVEEFAKIGAGDRRLDLELSLSNDVHADEEG